VDDFAAHCLELVGDLPIPTPYTDADFLDALAPVLGHLLLEHRPRTSSEVPDETIASLARSLPGLTPTFVRQQLSIGYDIQQEREATIFAALFQTELNRRRGTQ
jgi:hypothetical protein